MSSCMKEALCFWSTLIWSTCWREGVLICVVGERAWSFQICSRNCSGPWPVEGGGMTYCIWWCTEGPSTLMQVPWLRISPSDFSEKVLLAVLFPLLSAFCTWFYGLLSTLLQTLDWLSFLSESSESWFVIVCALTKVDVSKPVQTGSGKFRNSPFKTGL